MPTLPSTRITLGTMLQDCPACGKPITGRLEVEFSPDISAPIVEQNVEMSGKIIGCSVTHDCIPKVTRSSPFEVRPEDWLPEARL